ncbi:MAG: hypothetical protein WC869_15645 [Phycisphaerae bacterium]|jgi:hypothetical protein
MSNPTPLATISSTIQLPPPRWALLQRQLLETAGRAAKPFLARYTRDDGTLIWRKKFPGMDGSDDAYEGFNTFSLLYALGGDECLRDLGPRQYDAITRQFTEYGQVHNEFDAYYDWMHHGEGYHIFYYFGLAEPTSQTHLRRARKYAGMYIGEDPQAPNWDAGLKLLRSPLNGSKGPRFETTAEDWCTNREVYTGYLAPFEDIPGYSTADAPLTRISWFDDKYYEQVIRLINERMTRGDVPLNLASTSLVTNAYLYTGEEKYRAWVLEYYDAWRRRTADNGGIIPDNVGLSGRIGECMGGKWWGGYYGYRWSHGWRTIMESTMVAAGNCLLLTGDYSYLDLPRSQLDMYWSLGRNIDGVFMIPHRHGDGGWFDYRKPSPQFYLHLYHLSQAAEDYQRLLRCGDVAAYAGIRGGWGKSPIHYSSAPWQAYLQGKNADYPEQSLDATLQQVAQRLASWEADDPDVENWSVHHWQQRNPVLAGPLPQQTMGADSLYHGGLLHGRVRCFDPAARRPGLPAGVAAMVEKTAADGVTFSLVNTDAAAAHDVLVQAGVFGEHQFTTVSRSGEDTPPVAVNAQCFQVRLAPLGQVRLEIGMKRYAHQPSYRFPWE